MAQYKCTSCGLIETLTRMTPDCCSACGGSVFDLTRADAIAAKNDAFRRSIVNGKTKGVPPGQFFASQGVMAKGPIFQRFALLSVATQTTFDTDNDPYAEHDFGTVTVLGEKVFWKIDLYDPALEGGTEDPLDDKKTFRVLTICFPSEF